MKQRKFKIHFNRINMQRGDPRVWTVHTSDGCFQVNEVNVDVPMVTMFKPEAPQPRAYFTGWGMVEIVANTAYITVHGYGAWIRRP